MRRCTVIIDVNMVEKYKINSVIIFLNSINKPLKIKFLMVKMDKDGSLTGSKKMWGGGGRRREEERENRESRKGNIREGRQEK